MIYMALCRCVVLCGVVWRCVVLCGVVWCCVALCDVEWRRVAGVVLLLLATCKSFRNYQNPLP